MGNQHVDKKSLILGLAALGFSALFSISVRAGPLVFIHGIKGSSLVNSKGSIFWLDAWQALGLCTPQLALPLSWTSDGVQSKDDLEPAKILEEITIIPHLVVEKIYGDWLRSARAFGVPFYEFSYDWRRDNEESLKNFEAFVQDVSSKNGNQPVQIVAHSMGGLISFALANDKPELVERLYLVGSPLAGGMGFLEDLAAGTPNGLNRKILSPEVLGSFPSVYALFPFEGVDFYSVRTWRENQWGLFTKEVNGTQSLTQKENFLAIALDHARHFRMRLVAKNQKYPAITVIRGQGTPTAKSFKFKPEFAKDELCDGDGRVCESQANPPAGVPFEVISTTREHPFLLNDPAVIELIRSRLHP